MYIILKEKCSSCGLCADVCPVEAISQIGVYKIKTDLCIACGLCRESCPSDAIEEIAPAKPASPTNNSQHP